MKFIQICLFYPKIQSAIKWFLDHQPKKFPDADLYVIFFQKHGIWYMQNRAPGPILSPTSWSYFLFADGIQSNPFHNFYWKRIQDSGGSDGFPSIKLQINFFLSCFVLNLINNWFLSDKFIFDFFLQLIRIFPED